MCTGCSGFGGTYNHCIDVGTRSFQLLPTYGDVASGVAAVDRSRGQVGLSRLQLHVDPSLVDPSVMEQPGAPVAEVVDARAPSAKWVQISYLIRCVGKFFATSDIESIRDQHHLPNLNTG